ncbi:MAG: hypothetical protein NTU95_10785 [Methanothrix sp.]|nr:hypothetical protein [Methanothrix sp.]
MRCSRVGLPTASRGWHARWSGTRGGAVGMQPGGADDLQESGRAEVATCARTPGGAGGPARSRLQSGERAGRALVAGISAGRELQGRQDLRI